MRTLAETRYILTPDESFMSEFLRKYLGCAKIAPRSKLSYK